MNVHFQEKKCDYEFNPPGGFCPMRPTLFIECITYNIEFHLLFLSEIRQGNESINFGRAENMISQSYMILYSKK